MCVIVVLESTPEYQRANIRQEGDDPIAAPHFHKRPFPVKKIYTENIFLINFFIKTLKYDM